MQFVQNVGQFDPRARFQARGAGGTLWLADDALWLTVVSSQAGRTGPADVRDPGGGSGMPAGTGVHLKFTFAGANPHPQLEPFGRVATHTSYFAGRDPAQWHADVPVWGGVRYLGLYPGVDLELGSAGGQWQPRLRLEPGAAPDALRAVRLRIDGAQGIAIEGDHLRLATAAGPVAWPLFQADAAPGAPQVAGDEVQWPITLADTAAVLDARPAKAGTAPESVHAEQLVFSTYLGGSGDDSAWGMAQDRSGALYLSGITSSTNFPTTPGAFDTNPNGITDAYIAKISADATTLIYSTYLGGSGMQGARAIAVDDTGSIYATGYTTSTDFPITPGALQTTYAGGQDIFVTKLNANGTGLVYSTYVGGSGQDTGRDILLSPGGQAVVVGLTMSPDFPVTAGALQPTYAGATDGVIFKLNASGSALVFSTFLGGTNYDEMRAVAEDSQGRLYITGRTQSTDFPTTAGAYQTVAGGNVDAFVVRLSADGSALGYSTYLAGNDYDFGRGIAVDGTGSAYVTGLTSSTNFPTTPGALQTTYGTNQDAFVTKLSPDGSALVYSTFLGGTGGEAGRSVLVDAAGAAYLDGWTTSPNFPTTPDAYNQLKSGAGDAYAAKLNPSGSALEYSTYFGGSADDGAYAGIKLGPGDAIIVAGYAASANLPTTTGALQTVFGGGNDDAFLAAFRGSGPSLGHRIVLPAFFYNTQP